MAELLHEPNDESEQASGLVRDHAQVLLFRRSLEAVSPKQIHALAEMKIQELLVVDFADGSLMRKLHQILLGKEVHVVGTVDGLRLAKDIVCNRESAPEF